MTALSELSAAISTDLQLVVAAGTVIDLTNQRDDDSAVDTTLLSAVCSKAAVVVQRHLGATVDGDDYDAVEFGVRVALLYMQTHYAARLREAALPWVGGVMQELKDEAKARRQAVQLPEHAEEDFDAEDKRYPEETWDVDG